MTNPDCQRQTLTELLIRPVQRLPSMSLLMDGELKNSFLSALKRNKILTMFLTADVHSSFLLFILLDIFKHTKENNPDHSHVSDARAAIKKVLT